MGIGMQQELQGKYPEAEASLRQALAIMERAVGADNIDTARARDHLGVVLRAQGKYGEAEPQLKRALAAREQVLGANHPDVAATLDNLAVLYGLSGDDKNALAYSRRASAAVIARASTEASGQLGYERSRSLDARTGYFRHHVRNASRASHKGLEPASVLAGEALEIAEWAVQSSAATAVQQMALRFASADGVLASLVRERQDRAECCARERKNRWSSRCRSRMASTIRCLDR